MLHNDLTSDSIREENEVEMEEEEDGYLDDWWRWPPDLDLPGRRQPPVWMKTPDFGEDDGAWLAWAKTTPATENRCAQTWRKMAAFDGRIRLLFADSARCHLRVLAGPAVAAAPPPCLAVRARRLIDA